ncbi:3-oxoacid CoA-transferase subunit B/acetate CoA/acetoacetate CoA-transferase beta subunit [Mesocricetibacter intestinalis]|uniref:3-oxoacid CoA-transferase subunit B/acetate CoA/acetoacetate CoA-transferase beta subunit n=1 Tax=Mesocricetibacter intestinalis TaxID=1521930 RepID=A0A4R6VAI8_9PAST|nr:3-oxoacid CoA-transferase subunit B [Mesocricetibacter intestinalis]TDQ56821.1 3-oxoacid CoA-transferase subunit B/acetate CoA/acetoacetate CoA-transferase beta subunit [Mesocricetibacter intestinalis]
MSDAKALIAEKIASFFQAGDVVNLGIGIPGLVRNYIVDGVQLHAENGLLGYGGSPQPGEEEPDYVNAGGQIVTLLPGASVSDSAGAFALVRSGKLTAVVLGALQVDSEGSIANWSIPGGRIMGMGGAMDLVSGAKRVIVAMEHNAKNGAAKILKTCTWPLTGYKVVDTIVTELGVFEITPAGIVVKEMFPGVTQEEVIARTDAPLIFES